MIPPLAEALAARGYTTLTDVQQAVTAPELEGADLLVSAQTGSGKTVGFGLAIAPTLMPDGARLEPPAAPMALVIAPTRELAQQVQRELEWLYAATGARVVSCIGGMDARAERRALERGAHIVVGTPGRLRDHITRGALDLADLRAVVLDEADEMLDLGFREDLEFMLGAAPASRRTLLFSATVPPAIAELAKTYQRDAVRVSTQSRGSQHADISYLAVQVAAHDAENAIINLLRFHDAPTAIIFANTRATVARLAARLANRGLSVVSLSGELSQDERSHALQAMRDGRARVCVATDVAARGLDLPKLDLVIHADMPTNTETLLHRSGRTGRAGRKGISAMIVPGKAANKAQRLLKWAKIDAEWGFAPTAEEILALDEVRLMEDALWSEALSEDETAFAAKLLASHQPEAIAAACLRLYRAGLSAPEDLNAPPAANTAPDRAAFGPSVWIKLSVGRSRRAEVRWLLPLLCRAGNLDKRQIGKIRVQEDTSLVELAEGALAGFMAQIGPSGELEEGIVATLGDTMPEPDAPRGPRPKTAPRHGAPGNAGPKDAQRERPPRRAKPSANSDKMSGPRSDAPAQKRTTSDAAVAPYSKPRREGSRDKPNDEARRERHGKKPFAKTGPRPDTGTGGKPDGQRRNPEGKLYGKPGGKPGGKPSGKPRSARFDKSDQPAKGKPGGKPRVQTDKAGSANPPPARAGAADPSQRMTRPGARAPSGSPRKGGPKGGSPSGGRPRNGGGGGNAPPRRKG